MIKTLTRVGNSQALILDKTILGLIGVGEVELRIKGQQLIVLAAPEGKRRKLIDDARGKILKRLANPYQRLS